MNTRSDDCPSRWLSDDFELVRCDRSPGHEGVHTAVSVQGRVQWPTSAEYVEPVEPEPRVNPWEQLLPEVGTDVSVGFARRAGTIGGELEAVIFDDDGPRAIRLVSADDRMIVRWDAIESLQWFKETDDE
jgi:hypothetical protein